MADAASIEAAVAAAITTMLPMIQQPVPAAPTQPTQPVFALSPANAFTDIIDYSTKSGAEVYATNTAALETTFSIDKPNVATFLEELKIRAHQAKWNDPIIFLIPTGTNATPNNKNLLTEYGQITTDQCTQHTRGYITGSTRQTQNNHQLYVCLNRTLDATFKSKAHSDKGCC